MNNNLAYSFANFLENQGIGVLGQNLFIGQAPSSNKVPDSIWWIIAIGGTPLRLVTGETRNTYSISIFHRNRDYRVVYDSLQELTKTLNCAECVELEGFETLQVNAEVLMVDDDLDAEDRKLGVLQVVLEVYESCND